MILPFVKIPEIKINTEKVLNCVLELNSDQWHLLPWGQFVFTKWNGNLEISKLSSMFNKLITISVIECMRFDPGIGLPIHKDNKRSAVIQIPLSLNCASTPTLFYKENNEFANQISWDDDSAWLFDTHVRHNMINNSDQPRYMLCISFYKHTYSELLNLYKSDMLLVPTPGIEPGSIALQATAMTTFAKLAWPALRDLNSQLPVSKTGTLSN